MNQDSIYIRNRQTFWGRKWHKPAQTVRSNEERQRDLLMSRNLAGTVAMQKYANDIRTDVIADIYLHDPENADARIETMARDERLKSAHYWISNQKKLRADAKKIIKH